MVLTSLNFKCCGKKMINLGDMSAFNLINNNDIFCYRFICGNCGKIKDIHEYSLDDEELIMELENFEEELKDTKIYKELIEDKNN